MSTTRPQRFLEFERWWGGYYLMNEEEIRWIVNNLFIGNKLSQGEARLGPGRYFDLKSIKQPIIVFASMGDNITPPQQAFNWISDIYSSTEEIKANGQTIVGLIHEDIGHLGIFVSGKVAKKEHTQIVSVLKYIQALPPGLYGMEIHETAGADGNVEYDVTLHERKLEDLKRLQKFDRVDEKPFEAVAALSELNERAYELLVRPMVREAVPEWLGKVLREWHPLRVQRWWFSDRNPLLAGLPAMAAAARAHRRPRSADNLGRRVEHLQAEYVSAALDLYRDLRDAASEAAFFEVYGNMLSLRMADQRAVIRRQTRVRRARAARRAPGARRNRPGRLAGSDDPHRHADRQGGRRQTAPRADGAHARAARADGRAARTSTKTSSAACCTRRRWSSNSSRSSRRRRSASSCAPPSDRQKLNARVRFARGGFAARRAPAGAARRLAQARAGPRPPAADAPQRARPRRRRRAAAPTPRRAAA